MRGRLLLLVPLAACGASHGAVTGDDAVDATVTFDGPPGNVGSVDAIAHFQLDGNLADVATTSSLTCTGAECPTFVAGARGGAAMFNGTTTCLHAPWLTTWMPDRFTMSAWVQTASATNGPVVVHDFASACPAPAMIMANGSVGMVVLDTTKDAQGFSVGEHEQAWTPAQTVPQSAWQHVAVRWDGTAQQVFVGGTCTCAVTPHVPFNVKPNELDIGCYPSATTFFAGAIDEVQVFDRALSAAEIAELATADGRSAPIPVDCAASCGSLPPT